MSRISGSFDLKKIIDNLTAERSRDMSRIEGLFDNFGVTAKQDLSETFTKARATQQQGLITAGLSQTTRGATGRTDLLAKEQRGNAAIDESVAANKAGFLERQLVDPALISNLIASAAAVNTQPVQTSIGATAGQAAINAGETGLIRANRSVGAQGGTLSASGLIRPQTGGAPSAPGKGARVIPSPNAASGVGTVPGNAARVIGPLATAAGGGATPGSSLRSGQAGGSGSIRNSTTGEGFETKTGQDTPNAISAAATNVTAAAGTGRDAGSGPKKSTGNRVLVEHKFGGGRLWWDVDRLGPVNTAAYTVVGG